MKKNFKTLSTVVMIAAATTFAMTSCGGGMTEEEAEKAAQELVDGMMDDVEGAIEEGDTEGTEAEMPCEEGKCGDAMEGDSTATCGDGEAVEETTEH